MPEAQQVGQVDICFHRIAEITGYFPHCGQGKGWIAGHPSIDSCLLAFVRLSNSECGLKAYVAIMLNICIHSFVICGNL